MTPEQLRGLANTTGMIYDITMCREIFRAHAAALEEIERLNAAWKAQQFHLEAEERESAHWQERAEKAERRAERLEHHAEAMANAIQFGDLAILTVAKAAAEAYRAARQDVDVVAEQ